MRLRSDAGQTEASSPVPVIVPSPVPVIVPSPIPVIASSPIPAIDLLGIELHRISEAQCVGHIRNALTASRGGWVATPNLDHLRRLVKDAAFRALCARASLRVADGMALVWASRLQGTPLPERVAGSNLIWSLCEMAAQRGYRVFFLGGDPGTAEGAAQVLRQRYPGLEVAGTHCPPMGFESDPRLLRELIEALVASGPDIVFVGLGSPKQEELIEAIREQLPSAWWLGIGISFSFVTRAVKRAPRWMRSAGLEWLHRLLQEPRRLARRYLVQGIPFVLTLLLDCARRRASKRRLALPPIEDF